MNNQRGGGLFGNFGNSAGNMSTMGADTRAAHGGGMGGLFGQPAGGGASNAAFNREVSPASPNAAFNRAVSPASPHAMFNREAAPVVPPMSEVVPPMPMGGMPGQMPQGMSHPLYSGFPAQMPQMPQQMPMDRMRYPHPFYGGSFPPFWPRY